jgi:hypothetical protein
MRGYFHDHDLAKDNIAEEVKNAAYDIISKKHATYYGVAMATKRICEAIVRDEKSVMPVSSIQHGRYGINGVALSVPVIVGKDGIESEVPFALDDEEIEILAKTGAAASVAPYWSDAPVEKMLAAGINVVIGSDGPGDNWDLDMLCSARMFALNYRRDVGNRRFLSYEKLLEMITISAAEAVGLADKVGSLEEGKQAEIITINYQTPRLMPMYNPAHALILGGNGSDVRDVLVAGEVLMRDRKTPHVDEQAIYAQCQEVSDLINERIGWRDYEGLGMVLLALFVVVFIIENTSQYLRKKLS